MTSHLEQISHITQDPAPNYPRDSKFLAQYITLSNRYEIVLGEYSLLKLEKLIQLLETLKDKQLLTYYYEDLETNLEKLAKFLGISPQLLFLDLHESLQTPSITKGKNKYIELLTFNQMLKRLATFKLQSDQRELLQSYYDQYFSEL